MKPRKTFRPDPALAPEHMQTFQIAAPATTHFLEVPCDATNCDMAEHGWTMDIDLNTELGQRQARYIKRESGRKFTHESTGPGLVRLTFSSGQPCFRTHRVRNFDVPEHYLVKGGDWRGNPRGTPTRTHTRPEHWVEDFQENSEALNEIKRKG